MALDVGEAEDGESGANTTVEAEPKLPSTRIRILRRLYLVTSLYCCEGSSLQIAKSWRRLQSG